MASALFSIPQNLQRRVRLIAFSSASQLIFPASGLLVSLAVFRFCVPGLWGQFVNVLLILNFAPHIMGWGNKDYLLRAFSLKPASEVWAWRESLISRSLFVLPLLVFLLFYPVSFWLGSLIFIWCVARFVYQSYDVEVLYHKRFLYTFLLEAGSLLLLLACIYLTRQTIDIQQLTLDFTIAEILKMGIMVGLFKNKLKNDSAASELNDAAFTLKTAFKYFAAAFPFFIIGFSGLLQSRTDLICINYFMPPDKIGQFQVLTTFLLYIQAGSAYILTPFVKNIYRLAYHRVKSLAIKLFFLGIAIVVAGTLATYFVLIYAYHFDPGFMTMLLGALSILPVFFYLPLIYELYRYKMSDYVLFINLVGIVLGFVLNIVFITHFDNGIHGALAATATVQWLYIPVYLYFRSHQPKQTPTDVAS